MARDVNGYNPPVVTYKKVTVAGVDYSLTDQIKVSYNSPYNTVSITFRPNITLNRFIVNANTSSAAEEDIDIDKGTRLVAKANVNHTEDHTESFTINSTNFPTAGTYRIGLYAQSALDYSWDYTYLTFTIGGDVFKPADSDGFHVLTIKSVPIS